MDNAIIIFLLVCFGYWLAGKMGIGRKKNKVMVVENSAAITKPIAPVSLNWSAEDMEKIAEAFAAIQMELENKTTPIEPEPEISYDNDEVLNETIQEVIKEMTPPDTIAIVGDAEVALQKLGYKKLQIRKAIAGLDIAHKTASEIVTQSLTILNK